MKFLLQFFLTAGTSYVAELLLPWWSIAIIAFLIGLVLKNRAFLSFLGGFTAISSLWMIVAAIIDVKTESILSTKIAPIFHLSHPILLILLTGFIGGLVGGISALAGTQLSKLWIPKKGRYS